MKNKILSNSVKSFLIDLAVDLGISFTKLAYERLVDQKPTKPHTTKSFEIKTEGPKTPIRKNKIIKRRRK